MRLPGSTRFRSLVLRTVTPLSRIACSRRLHTPTRVLDAYLNFLMGKGSGAGWDLIHEIQAALSCVHRERAVVFDVGANVGEWSAGFLKASPTARLFLFEPSPGAQQAIRQRGLEGAVLIPYAVGNRVGKGQLHLSSASDPTASLHAHRESYFRQVAYHAIEIEIVTLDQIIQEQAIEFVDFIKMDIEGHELEALQGATSAFAARRIGALAFEFGAGNLNSRTFFRDLWDFLTGHGFRISRILPGGRLLAIEDYYEDCEYFRGVSNYVARLQDPPKPPA